MSRYNQLSITSNENENVANIGTLYYVTNSYPEIPLNSNDVYAITDFGDRLDTLANQFYGDPSLYWIIASANPDVVPGDSLLLAGGIQLRIPADINSAIGNYNRTNGLGTTVASGPVGTGGISAGASGQSSVSSAGGGGGGGGY